MATGASSSFSSPSHDDVQRLSFPEATSIGYRQAEGQHNSWHPAHCVMTLGGTWGKTVLENKYEKFERIIYGTQQKHDEQNDSYLARHDILFEDLLSDGATLKDVRAYILLRNSGLSPEDKRRVVIEADGDLTYAKVTHAIRMLGSKFFHEVQGQNKNPGRTKTYEVNMVQEPEEEAFVEEHAHGGPEVDVPEPLIEQLVNEGDEDAILITQFEDAVVDAIQENQTMNAFMSS